MLTLTIILSFIFIAHSYMNDTSYTAYPKTFIESDMLNDGSAFGLPSEYAFCGISLTQMKFLKLQYNCNCRKSCQCNGMFICNWCYNKLYTKSNVVTGFFCKFNSWPHQMSKSFRTGNKQSRNERIIMCPQNHYVTQVSPRINEQGFNGIKIKCETLNFNSTVIVEDDYSTPLMEPSTYQNKFVTGLQFQYQFNSNLEGVKAYFQQPHILSRVNFNYSQNSTQYGKIERKLIESVEHSNLNFVPLQKSLSFINPFQYEEVWENDKSVFQGYLTSQDIVTNHVGKLKGNQKSIYYNQTYERFKFGESVKTKVIPVKAINAIIPSCYKVIAKSYIDQQKVTIPYSVQISLSNPQTDSIITANATGRFIGFKTSYVSTEINFEKIQNCSQL